MNNYHATIELSFPLNKKMQANEALRLLVCHPGGAVTPAGRTYAQYLCNLLDGQLDVGQPDAILDLSRPPVFAPGDRDYDLVIFEEPVRFVSPTTLLNKH
jgi:hypothetical protein